MSQVLNVCDRCGETPHEIFVINVRKEFLSTGEITNQAITVCQPCGENMKKALVFLTSAEKLLPLDNVVFQFT